MRQYQRLSFIETFFSNLQAEELFKKLTPSSTCSFYFDEWQTITFRKYLDDLLPLVKIIKKQLTIEQLKALEERQNIIIRMLVNSYRALDRPNQWYNQETIARMKERIILFYSQLQFEIEEGVVKPTPMNITGYRFHVLLKDMPQSPTEPTPVHYARTDRPRAIVSQFCNDIITTALEEEMLSEAESEEV